LAPFSPPSHFNSLPWPVRRRRRGEEPPHPSPGWGGGTSFIGKNPNRRKCENAKSKT